jgi:hypothetical protein
MDAEKPDRIAFRVEVERDAEPIRGTIHTPEREHEFVGWVGLARALERIFDSGRRSRSAGR